MLAVTNKKSSQDYLCIVQITLQPRHSVRLGGVLELLHVHLQLPVEPDHLLGLSPLRRCYLACFEQNVTPIYALEEKKYQQSPRSAAAS